MKYISVCSGIEAASVAWHELGWEPVAFSEIEPFPSEVLKIRFPHVPNWGDMTKYESWPDTEVNLLVGGTPCQSFSVAGLRQGLKDPRGNLMLTFLAIADKYRPEWVIWENVPGVLSSNGGKDFESFLDGLEEIGYVCDVEILDAQFFGVAQRRKRVFVCAQSVETILSQKTVLSALTIAQCLAEILHGILIETLTVYEREPLKLGLASLSRDGVNRRMRLFGLLTENCNYRNWQQLLVDVFQKFPPELRNWDLPSGGKSEKELTLEDLLLGLNQEGQSTLTDESLNKALDGLYDLMRLYTTSTLTRETIASKIYLFFQIGEAIGRLICRLSGSSPNSSSAILSFLTLQTELTNYARKTSGKLFSEMDGFHPYDDFIKQAERTTSVIGNFGNRGSAAKVLFESESVSRHPAPSREKGKAVAGAVEDGVGNGSQWMSPNGADTVGTLRARDYKGPSTDSIHEGRGLAISAWWNGDQTASTVTTRSGGQYMPDKDNFGAVLTPIDVRDGISPTLTAKIQGSSGWAPYNETEHLVPMTPTVIDRAAFNQGENAQYDIKIEESQVMPSLVARGLHAVTVIDRSAMNAGFDFDRDPGIEQSDTTPTLIKSGPHGVAIPIAIQDVTTRDKAQNGKGWNDDGTAYTIDTHATQGVAQPKVFDWQSGGDARGLDLKDTAQLQRCQTPAVLQPISIQGNLVGRDSGDPQGMGASVDGTMYTLTKSDVHAVAHAFKIRGGSPTETGEYGGTPGKAAGKGYLGSDELAFTIAASQDQQIAYRKVRRAQSVDDFETWKRDEVMNCFDQGDVRAVNVVLEPIAVDTFNQTVNEHTSQILGSSATDVNHYGAVMMPPMAIRRLTPLECERLQGFPELKKITTFTIWLDHQNGCVNVEIKCRSERINAYHVEEKEKQESVLSAQENSNKNQVKNKNVAGLNVLLSYEPKVVGQHNLKKSFSSVLNVEQKNLFLQLIQQENFARQVAGINTMLEKEIGTGKEALQLNTMHFTRENNGRLHAILFGQEKEVSVNDVENTIKEITTYITSNLGQNTQNLNTNYQTWLCFVLNVIALFTHEKTNQKILFEISNQVGWTLIPWKNKPIEDCPDGPRYKACGNSMAVPCMRWIGQRINDAKTEIF